MESRVSADCPRGSRERLRASAGITVSTTQRHCKGVREGHSSPLSHHWVPYHQHEDSSWTSGWGGECQWLGDCGLFLVLLMTHGFEHPSVFPFVSSICFGVTGWDMQQNTLLLSQMESLYSPATSHGSTITANLQIAENGHHLLEFFLERPKMRHFFCCSF